MNGTGGHGTVRAVFAPLAAAGPDGLPPEDLPPDAVPPEDLRPHRPVREVVGLGGWVLGWIAGTVLAAGPVWALLIGYLWVLSRGPVGVSPAAFGALLAVGLGVGAGSVGAAAFGAVRLRRSRAACDWLVRLGRAAALAGAAVAGMILWVMREEFREVSWASFLVLLILGSPALGGLAFLLTGLWGRRFLDLKAW